MQEQTLSHWEEISGAFTIMDRELLRFIIKHNVPLERFTRLELANRSHDEDHRWIGFEKPERLG
jgi:hypothetical protein